MPQRRCTHRLQSAHFECLLTFRYFLAADHAFDNVVGKCHDVSVMSIQAYHLWLHSVIIICSLSQRCVIGVYMAALSDLMCFLYVWGRTCDDFRARKRAIGWDECHLQVLWQQLTAWKQSQSNQKYYGGKDLWKRLSLEWKTEEVIDGESKKRWLWWGDMCRMRWNRRRDWSGGVPTTGRSAPESIHPGSIRPKCGRSAPTSGTIRPKFRVVPPQQP